MNILLIQILEIVICVLGITIGLWVTFDLGADPESITKFEYFVKCIISICVCVFSTVLLYMTITTILGIDGEFIEISYLLLAVFTLSISFGCGVGLFILTQIRMKLTRKY